MKKYVKPLAVLLLQAGAFYLLPLFFGPRDVIGMVFLILFSTLVLAAVFGAVAGNGGLKLLYPTAVVLLFLPTVFLYYNETALIHALWYLVVSMVGLLLGSLFTAFKKKP